MSEHPRRSFVTGDIDIKALIACTFGVIFLGSILVFTTVVKDPSPVAIWTYRIVLALAAAGVAAVLPGFIDIRFKTLVQAGGALGVFVLVLMTFPTPSPGSHDPAPAWPAESAEPTALRYLELIDGGRLAHAFETIDPGSGIAWSDFDTAYRSSRMPLGDIQRRDRVGGQRSEDPSGMPRGRYEGIVFMTKHENDNECRQESILLRVTEEGRWRVFGHQTSLVQIPCIQAQR